MGTRRSPDMYTQERTYKKRSIKETYERDLRKRPIHTDWVIFGQPTCIHENRPIKRDL